ncbi:DUF4156 domain-containing protein [Collimonas arenae]|nr:DUF4156 domain-containing protein [Collimonas arenae]
MKKAIVVTILAALCGCSVPLAPEAKQVRLISDAEKQRCEFIRLLTVNQRVGPDKAGNAMRSILNATAAAGGNGFYLVSSSTNWEDGATVVGEALLCNTVMQISPSK